MNEFTKNIPTLRVLSQAMAFIEQGDMLKSLFAEMEETWLHLYTKDKTCPIVEQIGTTVKRKLVKHYTAKLITVLRNTIGLDLLSKTIDKDGAFWVADPIVHYLSDNKTDSHKGLFMALINAIFGISIDTLTFMLKEERTKEDLFSLLNQYYDVKIMTNDIDEPITYDEVVSALAEELQTGSNPLLSCFSF